MKTVLSALLGVSSSVLVSLMPLPHTRAVSEASKLLSQSEEASAEALESLVQAFRSLIAASALCRLDGQLSLTDTAKTPLSMVEGTRAWSLHVASKKLTEAKKSSDA
eukprot:CAMPEP_0173383334 /NCGR_PEP_ID=MMETSP1356-20130122/5892_1 /TAXON_ID=77927 ORGANISM="Hemiselmis virescens, Strain PCC157" /NCGR_SAMPLE_ID=MMETSP1356 /ASSEMBLY_ACC=CAM_ASM_000847 /LENGTH=106 /DNA_ID=CAMNT_0014338139 /DNA_START=39 /DNA_END=355 /DNA_ORIENTATION=-